MRGEGSILFETFPRPDPPSVYPSHFTPLLLQAAAMEEFPEEVAYRVLQQAGYDRGGALRRLRAESAERCGRASAWSKAEERQLRSAMASKKKDLHSIQADQQSEIR